MVKRAWRYFVIEMICLLITSISGGFILTIATHPLIRVPVGLWMAIISPGYLFLQWIYTNDERDNRLWILGLTIPTGVALMGLILLGLNYFWVYTLELAIRLIVLWNVGACLGLILLNARRRNSRVPFSWLLSVVDYLQSQPKAQYGKKTVGLFVFGFLFLVGSMVFAALVPKRTLPLTEFYVLSPSRTITGPILVDQHVKIGVINREGKACEYRIVILAESSSSSQALWADTISLKQGEGIEKDVNLAKIEADVQEIQLLLYKDGESRPYRSLNLVIGDAE